MAKTLLTKDTDLTEFFDLAGQLADMYRKELDKSGSVASGKLRSFTWSTDFNGTSLELYFDLPSYYIFIEEGRNPTTTSEGGVLYPRIRAWLDQKGITPRHGTRDSLARAITRVIHERGYFRPPLPKGRHPLANTLKAATANGLIGKMMTSVIDPLIGSVMVDLSNLAKR